MATAKRLDKPENNLFLVATALESFKDGFSHAELFAADVTKSEEIDALIKELKSKTDVIDVVFSNAGGYILKKFEDLTSEEIHTMIDLNLRSHIELTKALLPILRKSKNPQIIYMSSMAAKNNIVGESVYSASKSGISSFANVLRSELGPEVRVSTIHSWGVDTWGAENTEEFIQPQDVAETVAFIITRPPTVMIESIDLSNPIQWRGADSPWSPK